MGEGRVQIGAGVSLAPRESAYSVLADWAEKRSSSPVYVAKVDDGLGVVINHKN